MVKFPLLFIKIHLVIINFIYCKNEYNTNIGFLETIKFKIYKVKLIFFYQLFKISFFINF